MIKKLLIILPVAATIASCSSKENKYNTDVEVPVSIEEVKLNNIEEYFTATGSIVPVYESSIKSEASGSYHLQKNPVTGKPYKMGDKVKTGDLIVRIEDEEYENTVNIEGAKIDLDISKMEYDKQVALYEKGGVTLREKVNSEKQLVTAKKNYENAQLKLAKLQIKAPFDGYITNLPYYSPGVKIDQGAELVEFMSYKQMIMDIMLPESQITNVKLNQQALVTNYALPNDTLLGKVTQLSPAIDEESRTFRARIAIDNPEAKLRPGMFVKADIVIARKENVIVIPKDAIIARNNDKVVFIAQKETAREVVVTTGLEHEGMIEITDGLKVEQRLIVHGQETLRDRSKIKPLK